LSRGNQGKSVLRFFSTFGFRHDMLQRIHDSVGRWVAGIILGLLAVAFVFWGVDFSLGGTTFAAKVNGEKIPLTEFERELRARENEFRQTNRIEIDDELAREMRRAVIED